MRSIVPAFPHGGPPAALRVAAESLGGTWWLDVLSRLALGFHSRRWAATGVWGRVWRRGCGGAGFRCCLLLKVCWDRERLFRCLAIVPPPPCCRWPVPPSGVRPLGAPRPGQLSTTGLTSGLFAPPHSALKLDRKTSDRVSRASTSPSLLHPSVTSKGRNLPISPEIAARPFPPFTPHPFSVWSQPPAGWQPPLPRPSRPSPPLPFLPPLHSSSYCLPPPPPLV